MQPYRHSVARDAVKSTIIIAAIDYDHTGVFGHGTVRVFITGADTSEAAVVDSGIAAQRPCGKIGNSADIGSTGARVKVYRSVVFIHKYAVTMFQPVITYSILVKNQEENGMD